MFSENYITTIGVDFVIVLNNIAIQDSSDKRQDCKSSNRKVRLKVVGYCRPREI
jgi:hypothetical protein